MDDPTRIKDYKKHTSMREDCWTFSRPWHFFLSFENALKTIFSLSKTSVISSYEPTWSHMESIARWCSQTFWELANLISEVDYGQLQLTLFAVSGKYRCGGCGQAGAGRCCTIPRLTWFCPPWAVPVWSPMTSDYNRMSFRKELHWSLFVKSCKFSVLLVILRERPKTYNGFFTELCAKKRNP